MRRYIHGAVAIVWWLAIVEYRLVANMWPALFVFTAWAIALFAGYYALDPDVPVYVAYILFFLGVIVISRIHEWLDGRPWYDRFRFTGHINPAFDSEKD